MSTSSGSPFGRYSLPAFAFFQEFLSFWYQPIPPGAFPVGRHGPGEQCVQTVRCGRDGPCLLESCDCLAESIRANEEPWKSSFGSLCILESEAPVEGWLSSYTSNAVATVDHHARSVRQVRRLLRPDFADYLPMAFAHHRRVSVGCWATGHRSAVL